MMSSRILELLKRCEWNCLVGIYEPEWLACPECKGIKPESYDDVLAIWVWKPDSGSFFSKETCDSQLESVKEEMKKYTRGHKEGCEWLAIMKELEG